MAKNPNSSLKRTTISMDALVYAAGVRRMNDTGFPSFTAYLEGLVRDDYKNKPREVGAVYDLSELRAEAARYISEGQQQQEKDTAAKRAKPKKHRKSSSIKQKRGRLSDLDWVSLSILGASSCGKLTPSEATVLGTIKVPFDKYPDDVFGLYAQGDSMNRAKIKDGRTGINDGDVIICRTINHEPAEVGKIVVVLVDGETCIKRLAEDAKGKFLAPESKNTTYKPIRLTKHARVQAVVIDKV